MASFWEKMTGFRSNKIDPALQKVLRNRGNTQEQIYEQLDPSRYYQPWVGSSVNPTPSKPTRFKTSAPKMPVAYNDKPTAQPKQTPSETEKPDYPIPEGGGGGSWGPAKEGGNPYSPDSPEYALWEEQFGKAPTPAADQAAATPAPSTEPGDLGPDWVTMVHPDGRRRAIPKSIAKAYFKGGWHVEGSQEAADAGITGTGEDVEFKADADDVGEEMDFTSAFENDEYAKYFGKMFGDIQEAQEEYLRIRGESETNVESLKESREEEGMFDARQELQEANREVAEFNAMVQNVENDVRRDLGPNVSESFIQAEKDRRLRDLEPEANRLIARQQTALANYEMTVDRTTEMYNAMRADASEKVNLSATKLGLDTDNLNTAVGLYSSLKQFEAYRDYQKNQKRDDARAMVTVMMQYPKAFANLSEQDVRDLEQLGDFPTGALETMRQTALSRKEVLFQNIDDSGNLNMFMWDPDMQAFVKERIEGFAEVASALTVSATAGKVGDLANMTEPVAMLLQGLATELNTTVAEIKADDSLSDADKQAKISSLVSIKSAEAAAGFYGLPNKSQADYNNFKTIWQQTLEMIVSPETAAQKAAGAFSAETEAIFNAIRDNQ